MAKESCSTAGESQKGKKSHENSARPSCVIRACFECGFSGVILLSFSSSHNHEGEAEGRAGRGRECGGEEETYPSG